MDNNKFCSKSFIYNLNKENSINFNGFEEHAERLRQCCEVDDVTGWRLYRSEQGEA